MKTVSDIKIESDIYIEQNEDAYEYYFSPIIEGAIVFKDIFLSEEEGRMPLDAFSYTSKGCSYEDSTKVLIPHKLAEYYKISIDELKSLVEDKESWLTKRIDKILWSFDYVGSLSVVATVGGETRTLVKYGDIKPLMNNPKCLRFSLEKIYCAIRTPLSDENKTDIKKLFTTIRGYMHE